MGKYIKKRENVIIDQITLITGVKSIIKALKTKEVVEVSVDIDPRFLQQI